MNKKLRSPAKDELFKAVLQLENVEDCYDFFEDLCTIHELEALSQRFKVAEMLDEGEIYETIVEKTGASSATISRIKRCLLYGADGYRKAIDRLKKEV